MRFFNAVRNNGIYFTEVFPPQLQIIQVQKHQEDDTIHDVGNVVLDRYTSLDSNIMELPE